MPSWMKNTGMLLPTRSKVPSVGVELRGEAAGVADGVGRAAGARARWRTGRRPASPRPSPRKPARQIPVGVAVADEDAVRPGAARVHHPLGDALVVEVRDLLAQVVVLEQGRPALARLQRVVGVAQPQHPGRSSGRRPAGPRRSAQRPSRRRSPYAGRVRPGRAWAAAALRLGRLLEAGRFRRRSTRDGRGVVAPGQRGEGGLGCCGDRLLGGLDDGAGELAGVGHVVSSVRR